MIKELDTIVLTVNVPEFGLHAGDLGTVDWCISTEGMKSNSLRLMVKLWQWSR